MQVNSTAYPYAVGMLCARTPHQVNCINPWPRRSLLLGYVKHHQMLVPLMLSFEQTFAYQTNISQSQNPSHVLRYWSSETFLKYSYDIVCKKQIKDQGLPPETAPIGYNISNKMVQLFLTVLNSPTKLKTATVCQRKPHLSQLRTAVFKISVRHITKSHNYSTTRDFHQYISQRYINEISYVNYSCYEFQFKDGKTKQVFGTGHSVGEWKSWEKQGSLFRLLLSDTLLSKEATLSS